MPKVQPIDAFAKPQTQPESPRIIKALTNASPSNPPISAQSAPPATSAPEAAAITAPTPEERQGDTTEANSEAKPLSPQYAALARKEAAIRTKEKDVQAKEASFKAQEAEFNALKAFKAKLQESPLDALNEMGITYDQLVEQAVNQPNPEMKSVKDELKAIKEAQAKSEESAKARETAQRDAAVKQIEYDATALVDSDPNFATVKEAGAVSDVVDLIVRTFDESGKLLTVEEAAAAIETELFEEAMRITGFSKVKAKLTPQVVEASKEPSKQQPAQIKTLTNTMTANRPMTARERAILAFENKLIK